jgi:hypothetical protein
MTSSASNEGARAIATPWRSPPDMVPTNESGVTAWDVKRRNSIISFCVSLRMPGRSSSPRRVVRSRPMKMFRHNDCWSRARAPGRQVSIPSSRARCTERCSIGSPFHLIVPLSGGWNPVTILISVDLPAAVVAEQTDDLVDADREADVLERADMVERLRDALQLEQVRRRRLHGRVRQFRRERRRDLVRRRSRSRISRRSLRT